MCVYYMYIDNKVGVIGGLRKISGTGWDRGRNIWGWGGDGDNVTGMRGDGDRNYGVEWGWG